MALKVRPILELLGGAGGGRKRLQKKKSGRTFKVEK